MGRVISAVAMMGAQLKGEKESVTLSLRGDGPAGAVVAVSRRGTVKITIDDPAVELPPRPDGKLDVGGAIGRAGRLAVVRDLGFGEPYVGQVSLVSGEVAEDVAMYYTASEQIPTLCALGVLERQGEDDWRVAASGGLLVQAMPGCGEELLSALELRSQLFTTLSATLEQETLEDILAQSFRGLQPDILQNIPLTLACDCSRARIARALITLGEEELADMRAQQHGAQVHCHFCGTGYDFTAEDLTALMAQAAPGPEKGREEGQS
jgi:molecular chaperone Hsp33